MLLILLSRLLSRLLMKLWLIGWSYHWWIDDWRNGCDMLWLIPSSLSAMQNDTNFPFLFLNEPTCKLLNITGRTYFFS